MAAIITPTQHEARNRRKRTENEKETEDEFDTGNKSSVELWKRNPRCDQCLAHLFASLGHKQFAAPGKKKEQTDGDSRDENSQPLRGVQFS
jgi:hypothetical protein